MGKLLDLLRGSVPAQRPATSRGRVGGTLVDLHIVGEAPRQDYLQHLLRTYGRRQFEITLWPEPSNPYDPNAVVVLVDGYPVGYLARDMAAVWQPMVAAAASEGYAVVGPAQLLGGTRDKPSLGVFGAAPWPGRDVPVGRWGH